MFPKALKSCPKCKKSLHLVTLARSHRKLHQPARCCHNRRPLYCDRRTFVHFLPIPISNRCPLFGHFQFLSLSIIILSIIDNGQCDQMTILFFEYLAIYCNENSPFKLEICQSLLKIYSNTKLILKMFPNTLKFCLLGKILPNLVTLTTAQKLFCANGHLVKTCRKGLLAILWLLSLQVF